MTQTTEKPVNPARRRGVLVTAWAIGLVALGIHVAFLLSVMLP